MIKLFIHKLANVPSGITPAKQAWIPIIRNINSFINSAQQSFEKNHLPPFLRYKLFRTLLPSRQKYLLWCFKEYNVII